MRAVVVRGKSDHTTNTATCTNYALSYICLTTVSLSITFSVAMKIRLFLLWHIMSLLLLAAASPDYQSLANSVRTGHPRLFLTAEQLPEFKSHALTAAKEYYELLEKRLANYTRQPQLQLRPDLAKIEDGQLVFLKKVNDQNAAIYAFVGCGGYPALDCTIAYLVTGQQEYRDMAWEYLRLHLDFLRLADRSRIMPEWFHCRRLAALVAYDWLYNDLTPEQRREFIVPMLEHIRNIQHADYTHNVGGFSTGNYGDPGLQWYAGLAAFRDGFADEIAEELLRQGFENQRLMMEQREALSQGTGFLVSSCTDYSFGAYPWASFNFLRTLRSACSFDATAIWPHIRNYANFFDWMAITDPTSPTGFRDFGWGDATHTYNALSCRQMYTHLAQIIDLYPEEAPRARALQQSLAPDLQHLPQHLGDIAYPFLPFVMLDFQPAGQESAPADARCQATAAFFPTCGLLVMRSGTDSESTYAAFKGGSGQESHQHYDKNSFIIYRQGFQALDSGLRGATAQHLAYFPQTVAHNSLLIRMPDEPLAESWLPANTPAFDRSSLRNDGGQYSLDGAKSFGFDISDYHAATGGDATACYRQEKCAEAIRQFVFIKPDYFIVYDRVASRLPEQEKVFLLHTEGQPQPLSDGSWRSQAAQGALFLKTLLPDNALSVSLGGPGREFYTNGVNFPPTEQQQKQIESSQTWAGQWRLEISAREEQTQARFLHLLQTSRADCQAMVSSNAIATATDDGVEFTAANGDICRVLFHRQGSVGGNITIRRQDQIILDRPLPGQ